MSFADNIIKVRKENSLTQEQLAEELNVSRQAISKWERGIGYPEIEKILYICKKYGISMDELFADEIGVKTLADSDGEVKIVNKGFFEQLSDWWTNLSVNRRKFCKFILILFIVLAICSMSYNLGYGFGKFVYNILH